MRRKAVDSYPTIPYIYTDRYLNQSDLDADVEMTGATGAPKPKLRVWVLRRLSFYNANSRFFLSISVPIGTLIREDRLDP